MAKKPDDLGYIYAVARIRSDELSLLSASMIEQLLALKTYKECMTMLVDKGWGNGQDDITSDEMLAIERDKIWQAIEELLGEDKNVMDVFLYANDFHNLKAAIKLVCRESDEESTFLKHGSISAEDIYNIVRKKEFYLLPEAMRYAAEEAYNALSQTQDGQLCDVILDKAALDAIYNAGHESGDELIQKYAEMTVFAADVKMAVRSYRTGKQIEFVRRALAECDTLDVSRLARAAVEGIESICEYLNSIGQLEAAQALEQSASAFEIWCDNQIIELIRPQLFVAHGLGPIAAYVLARENEIKVVRIILSGKLNQLPDAAIRERVREMYV